MRKSALPAAIACAGLLVAAPQAVGQSPPAGDALHLHGAIAPGLTYRVRTAFMATANMSECKFDDQISGVIAPLRREVDIDPVIAGGRHRLVSPLTMEDGGRCAWQPVTLSICVAPSGASVAGNCEPVLLYRLGEALKVGHLLIQCDSGSGRCLALSGKRPAQIVSDMRQDIAIDITSSP